MSGHSEFAPIGSRNPSAPMPPAGPVGGNAGQSANVPQVQLEAQPENAPPEGANTRSMIQKLDAMLLKAANMSTKAVDESSIKKLAKMPGVGKAESDAITASAEKARRTMMAVSAFTGRQIASAFVANERGVFEWKDNNAAAAIRAAIDAQAELSEKLHDLANRPGIADKTFDAVVNLALQCDRRQTEIASLALQLAESAAGVDNDPAAAKRLDMKLAALLPRQALSMHGNAEALEQMKAKLQPLADRLENFATRPNASLSSAEFTKYAVELKDACEGVRHAAANGFAAPDVKIRRTINFLDEEFEGLSYAKVGRNNGDFQKYINEKTGLDVDVDKIFSDLHAKNAIKDAALENDRVVNIDDIADKTFEPVKQKIGELLKTLVKKSVDLFIEAMESKRGEGRKSVLDAIPKEDEDVSEILFSLNSKIVEVPYEDKIIEIKNEPEEEKISEV